MLVFGQADGVHKTPVAEIPQVSLSDRKLLLVEDSMETREALAKVLAEAGAKVTAVASVSEALDAFDRLSPDLILSDIGLGDSSGHLVIAEIRKRENQSGLSPTPALALTAYADEINRRKSFESGFQDCTTKPIEPPSLLAKLANRGSKRQ